MRCWEPSPQAHSLWQRQAVFPCGALDACAGCHGTMNLWPKVPKCSFIFAFLYSSDLGCKFQGSTDGVSGQWPAPHMCLSAARVQLLPLMQRWQTQGPQAESCPPPCFIRHLVSTWQQHPPCPKLRSSYIYTVLKLHSAL